MFPLRYRRQSCVDNILVTWYNANMTNLQLLCRNGHDRSHTTTRPSGRKVCTICAKLRHQRWRQLPYNANKIKAWTSSCRKKSIPKRIQLVRDAKAKPCMDCKQYFPYYVMDFDHQRDKAFLVSRHIWSTLALHRLQEEIDKCEVVCANCHRERTHGPKRLSL